MRWSHHYVQLTCHKLTLSIKSQAPLKAWSTLESRRNLAKNGKQKTTMKDTLPNLQFSQRLQGRQGTPQPHPHAGGWCKCVHWYNESTHSPFFQNQLTFQPDMLFCTTNGHFYNCNQGQIPVNAEITPNIHEMSETMSNLDQSNKSECTLKLPFASVITSFMHAVTHTNFMNSQLVDVDKHMMTCKWQCHSAKICTLTLWRFSEVMTKLSH